MFEVIKGKKTDEKDNDIDIKYTLAYAGTYLQAFNAYLDTECKDDLYKLVYNGVMYINKVSNMAIENQKGNNEFMQSLFENMEEVKGFIKLLTPNELIRIFPIEKTYDGSRWETKDYFSTMKALVKHGLDNPIGDDIDDILWNYMNFNISIFQVHLTSVVSNLYRIKTGRNLFEEFCENQGITTHTLSTDPKTGRQYLTNGDTGETTPVSKPKPRYLKLLQGGEVG